MYNPTDEEINICKEIVKDVFGVEENFNCEKSVDEILKIIYAIGGDYSKKTIRSVAEALYEKNVVF